MTKFDWTKARKQRDDTANDRRQLERAADRILARAEQPRPVSRTVNDAGRSTYRVRKHSQSTEICIVVGADAPSNKTGQRLVHIFKNLVAAHKAGFTWAL